MGPLSQKRNLKKMVQALPQGLMDEGLEQLWDAESELEVESRRRKAQDPDHGVPGRECLAMLRGKH